MNSLLALTDHVMDCFLISSLLIVTVGLIFKIIVFYIVLKSNFGILCYEQHYVYTVKLTLVYK